MSFETEKQEKDYVDNNANEKDETDSLDGFVEMKGWQATLGQEKIQKVSELLKNPEFIESLSLSDFLLKIQKEASIDKLPSDLEDILITEFKNFQNNKSNQDRQQYYLKLAASTVATLAIIYFGKPVGAITARALYEIGYEKLIGIPSWYNPSYYLTYVPGREHAANLGYQYGSYALGAAAAVAVPAGSSAISTMQYVAGQASKSLTYLFSKASSTDSAATNKVMPSVDEDDMGLEKLFAELNIDAVENKTQRPTS